MIGKQPEDFLFTREGNRPVRVFRDEWERATRAAGAPHLLFHDLCRFAARYLDNAGVSQKVGMEIMGRKTPSIYFRYRIVDRKDKDAGVDKLVEYRQQQRVRDFSGHGDTDTSTDTSAQGTERSEMKSVVIE